MQRDRDDDIIALNGIEPHSANFMNKIISASEDVEQVRKRKRTVVPHYFFDTILENMIPQTGWVMACALVIGFMAGVNDQSTSTDTDDSGYSSIFDNTRSIL